MKRFILLFALAAAVGMSGHTSAQRKSAAKGSGYLLLDISTWKPGRYPIIVNVDADGRASAVPLQVTKLDGTISDPGTQPPIPSPSNLRKAVLDATKAVQDPAKEDNAVGIALGYSIVSSRLSAGSVTISEAQKDIKELTDKFLAKRNATAQWAQWRKDVGAALTAESKAGRLKTKEQVAAAFETIANGLVSSGDQKIKRTSADAHYRELFALAKGRFRGILKVLLAILPEVLGDGDLDILDLVEILSGLLKKG